MSVIKLGQSIPAITPHATSVSLPQWRDNVGYEEGDQRVVSKMTTGYPRFFIHKLIATFSSAIVKTHGGPNQEAMLFPSTRAAQRCLNFILAREKTVTFSQINVINLTLDNKRRHSETLRKILPSISAVLFPREIFPVAKQYWQHSGDGISSRRAEFCHNLFQEGILIPEPSLQPITNGLQKACKGPRRYQKISVDHSTANPTPNGLLPGDSTTVISNGLGYEVRESSQFLEERFGRNLDISFVVNAKSAIRHRIAGCLVREVDICAMEASDISSDARGVAGLTEDDVHLWPCGMNAIFHVHRMLMEVRGTLKSVSFGFPYVDTLKILQKFGPGCVFYGNGSSGDLINLESRLESGERFLALFCEFPGNPMLECPDLQRIRRLADKYDFAVVVDETIGNFINVDVLPFADVVVSSLTKIFSGECNVMGGGSVLNPQGRYYKSLKKVAETDYEDNYWAEDAIFMERNSRDFVWRIERINENAQLICDILRKHPLIKDICYPKYNSSRPNYDACRTPNGGYGGLLSFTFQDKRQAIAFFDRIETAKGPSLGTNFTLVSPYVLLAHYLELDWCAQFGVPADLIRVSVGLEDGKDLKSRFEIALKAAEAIVS